MAKLTIFGTTVRQLEANKAYHVPNIFIDGEQTTELHGCGITTTFASSDDGADSYPCVVSVNVHDVCFTPLVSIPNSFGMTIELLCYLVS